MNMQRALLLTVLALPLAFGAASAQEKELKRSDLPPAVEKTVAAQTKGATIKGISMETENGKTIYEIETMVGSRSRDMLIDADGGLLEVEEEVAIGTLPAPIQAQIRAKAGDAKITRVEAVSKNGTLVQYDAAVDKGGKTSEITVKVGG